jgi:hypothetical protein
MVCLHSLGDWAKRRALLLLNLKLTIGSPLRWSKPAVSVKFAGDDDTFRDDVNWLFSAFGAFEQLRIRRHVALQRLIDRGGLVDQPEC